MGALLKCENVSLGYEGDVVTKNLNFTVNSGDYLCIVGENGSGKSTLIKALLGLKPQLSGNISLCGEVGKNEIGYLPQQTMVQRDFPASVREIVQSGCMNRCGFRPFYSKEEKKLAHDMMRRLEIEPLAKRCYRELSGGQQQRVLLARALCAARKMILLDEPVTGLDPKATNEMYELIDSLNKKDGITVIMVSHDMNAAVKYASHILHVGRKQLFFGTKEDYLTSKTGQAFLAVMGGEEDE
ncbi:metal ABC transporter ATP-binding protein [Ruminococcus flavefaciens]|uniref:metal ABC transporter ATP-binding protein n=1 Tax=Ruminococcus flavefaciens TaxID=1265 RepID=UPI0026EDB39C|nr:ABC transporter ATP-binding protein [Ruminococcus flavefaciens]MDD7515931.1 ABC transporter ATP-binding protein [Ruminococcus flavefaciens]MDY5691448.1 ABC transporter ATP-binding protein [Ruminococcus flavefaciens]